MTGDELWDGNASWMDEAEVSPDERFAPGFADDELVYEHGLPPKGCAEATYVCRQEATTHSFSDRDVTFRFHRTEADWLYVWCGLDVDETVRPGEACQTLVWGDTEVAMICEHTLAAGETLHLSPSRLAPGPLPRPPQRIVITLPGGATLCALAEVGRGWPL